MTTALPSTRNLTVPLIRRRDQLTRRCVILNLGMTPDLHVIVCPSQKHRFLTVKFDTCRRISCCFLIALMALIVLDLFKESEIGNEKLLLSLAPSPAPVNTNFEHKLFRESKLSSFVERLHKRHGLGEEAAPHSLASEPKDIKHPLKSFPGRTTIKVLKDDEVQRQVR